MPVTKSKQYAKFDTLGLTQRPDSIVAEGRICFLNDEITLVGDEAANDEIKLLPLPRGALVDPARSQIITSGSTGVTVDIGLSGDADNIADGIALTTAGSRPCNASAVDLVKVEDEGELLLTVKSGAAIASATFRVSIAYYVR